MRAQIGIIRIMGLLLAASLCVTEGLLLFEGRWREALPLHLCAAAAGAALLVALGTRGDALDFLWYLGVPGALLALCFPAPAASRHQLAFNLSYAATHALIPGISLAAWAAGAYPRPGRTARMMLMLQGLALAAFFVNEALGTNFLFLSFPPAATPLEAVYALGYPVYILFLEGLMLAVCLVQGRLTHRFQSVQIRLNAL